MKYTLNLPLLALSDDLTGTLGLSILIANENIPVRAIPFIKNNYDPLLDKGHVVVINTETRSVGKKLARKKVSSVIHRFPENTVIIKRFDTTLRGYPGEELAEIMTLRPNAVAIVVPSYPAGGRLCIGGYQQLNGIPIEKTEAANDPTWPIKTSYVPEYFMMAGKICHIPLHDVTAGIKHLSARIKEVAHPGTVIVLDAYSDFDISVIAQASLRLKTEIILVSPGPFLGAFLGLKYRKQTRKTTLVINGSATQRTRMQVAELQQKYSVQYLDIPRKAIQEKSESKIIKKFLREWDSNQSEVLVLRPEQEKIDISLQPHIIKSISEATNLIVKSKKLDISGLVLSGGETAAAVLKKLDTFSIHPVVEFDSLVMGGIIMDGTLNGIKLVTKGGMVGDKTVLLKALRWILKEDE